MAGGGNYCWTSAEATEKTPVFHGNLMSIDLALAAGGMGRELACGEITKPLIHMFFTCDFLYAGFRVYRNITCSSLPSSFGVHTFCALTSSLYCQKHNYPPSLRCLLMLQNVCREVTDQEVCTDTDLVQQIHCCMHSWTQCAYQPFPQMRPTEWMNLQSNTVTSHCILSNSCFSITAEGLVVEPVQGGYGQALTQYFSFQWATIQQQSVKWCTFTDLFHSLHPQNTS